MSNITLSQRQFILQMKGNQLAKVVGNLAGRWQSERWYENFNDYVEAAKKACEMNLVNFISLKQTKMTLKFKEQVGGLTAELFIKSNRVHMRIWNAGE